MAFTVDKKPKAPPRKRAWGKSAGETASPASPLPESPLPGGQHQLKAVASVHAAPLSSLNLVSVDWIDDRPVLVQNT